MQEHPASWVPLPIAVLAVTDDRAAELGQMCPDLVAPAGLEAAFQQHAAAAALEGAVMRDGPLPPARDRAHDAALVLGQARLDAACRRTRHALDERQVHALEVVRLEHLVERAPGLRSTRDDEHAAGLL